MSDTEFDTALVGAAFRLAGEHGWRAVNVTEAARAAGLSLAEARGRFPSRASILLARTLWPRPHKIVPRVAHPINQNKNQSKNQSKSQHRQNLAKKNHQHNQLHKRQYKAHQKKMNQLLQKNCLQIKVE